MRYWLGPRSQESDVEGKLPQQFTHVILEKKIMDAGHVWQNWQQKGKLYHENATATQVKRENIICEMFSTTPQSREAGEVGDCT